MQFPAPDVISIGNGVLSSKCPGKMATNGGKMTLSVKWTRNILKSMNWVKPRGRTAKRTISPALFKELTFTWKIKIVAKIPAQNL